MSPIDVKYADTALMRLCAMRVAMPRADFYRQCDRLLDMRNRAALVVKLEAEHAELAGAR